MTIALASRIEAAAVKAGWGDINGTTVPDDRGGYMGFWMIDCGQMITYSGWSSGNKKWKSLTETEARRGIYGLVAKLLGVK